MPNYLRRYSALSSIEHHKLLSSEILASFMRARTTKFLLVGKNTKMPKYIILASTIAYINVSNGGPCWIRLELVSNKRTCKLLIYSTAPWGAPISPEHHSALLGQGLVWRPAGAGLLA